jgi:hypothetical protein
MSLTPVHLPPFPFFSLAALAAGWYLAWRTLPHTIAVLIVSELIASRVAPGSSIVGLPVGQGLAIVLMFPVYRLILDGLVADFATTRWGIRPAGSVWWAITWRNFEANGLAVVLGRALDAIVDPWLAHQPRAVEIAAAVGQAMVTIVVLVMVWGWITGRVLARTPPFDEPLRMAARQGLPGT